MQLNKKCIYLFSYYSFHSYYFASEYKTDHSSPNYFLAAQISRLPSSDRILSGSDLGEIPNVKSYLRLRPESGTRQGLSDITQIMFISSLAWLWIVLITILGSCFIFSILTVQFCFIKRLFSFSSLKIDLNICGMGQNIEQTFVEWDGMKKSCFLL